MKNIFKLLKSQTKNLIIFYIFLILATISNLFLPAIMSKIVDVGIKTGNMDYILKWGLIMFAIATVGIISFIIATKLNSEIISNFVTTLSKKIYKKTLSLGYDDMSKIGTNSLLTRSTEDISIICQASFALMNYVALVPILLIGGVILSFSQDVMLSVILLSLIPILMIIVGLVAKKIVPRWKIANKYIDKQNQLVRERLNGIRVIRAFNKEPYEHKRLSDSTNVMAENIIKANLTMQIINPIYLFILNCIVVIIAYVGSLRIVDSNLTAGSVFAVIQYVTLITSGFLILSFFLVFLPKIKVSYYRINDVLSVPDAVEPMDDYNIKFTGNVEFKDVEFTYEGAPEPAISNINFEINPGETVAFIGGTGSGKSTLLNVMLKFNKITGGDILFDGVSINDISSKRLRDMISAVMQKSSLLMGTIEENIKMGKEDATEDEIKEACKIAQIDDFIETLPDEYEHKLDQNGTNVSGGQKQRLAIARALIKDSPIYVFDDSFSALDFYTEAKLRKSLNEKLFDRTKIIITQRVASAMSCDKVYVLDKGQIVGRGQHADLLKSCPIYKEIYDSQIGGDLIEK